MYEKTQFTMKTHKNGQWCIRDSTPRTLIIIITAKMWIVFTYHFVSDWSHSNQQQQQQQKCESIYFYSTFSMLLNSKSTISPHSRTAFVCHLPLQFIWAVWYSTVLFFATLDRCVCVLSIAISMASYAISHEMTEYVWAMKRISLFCLWTSGWWVTWTIWCYPHMHKTLVYTWSVRRFQLERIGYFRKDSGIHTTNEPWLSLIIVMDSS